MASKSKDKIQELLDLIGLTEGWRLEETASSGRWRIYPPNGDPILSPANGQGRSLANFTKELERAGFNPDAAMVAKREKAQAALVADREKNSAALAAAAERAQKLVVAPSPGPAAVFKPVAVSTEAEVMAAYPHEVVYVTFEWAYEALQRKQCKQRALYKRTVDKYKQAMRNGEWALNPIHGVVFDEHGCLINAMHSLTALFELGEELLAVYPHGVPFYVTYNFPSKLAHIFDTGRARTAPDALSVEGLKGWGTMQAAALRLCMSFDQSFDPERSDRVTDWRRWRSILWTNSELVEGAAGPYAGLLDFNTLASGLHTHAKITRTAGLAAGFLIERDNPQGAPGKSNEEFWEGVQGKSTLHNGDPRMSLLKFSMREAGRKSSEPAVLHLAHILSRYADWHLGKPVQRSTVHEDEPMPPVWREGMRWIGNELRYPRGGAGYVAR